METLTKLFALFLNTEGVVYRRILQLDDLTFTILSCTLIFAFLLVLAIVFTYFLIIYKKRNHKRSIDAERRVQEFLASPEHLVVDSDKKIKDQYELSYLKDSLLDLIALDDQLSRSYFELYVSYSFNQIDKKNLFSSKWYKRLDGVLSIFIYINFLSEDYEAILKRVKPLTKDRKLLVQISSYKLIARTLSTQDVRSFLMDVSSKSFLRHEQFLLDIMLEVSRVSSQQVLAFILENPNSYLARVGFKSILKLKLSNASKPLVYLLKNHSFNKNENLVALIKACGSLKAIGACEKLKTFIPHEDDEVEIAALLALYQIESTEFDVEYFEKLIDDDVTHSERVGEVLSYIHFQQDLQSEEGTSHA